MNLYKIDFVTVDSIETYLVIAKDEIHAKKIADAKHDDYFYSQHIHKIEEIDGYKISVHK